MREFAKPRSLSSSALFNRLTSGARHRGHMAGVADQAPPANFQRVASAGSRVQSGHTTCIGSRCLPAPRGSSPGLRGCTNEHLKVLMDDQDTLELLFEAATSLAQAAVPASVAAALTTARLTAALLLGVSSGGWSRGSGSPFQTRAGTHCVGHLIRAATDASTSATVLSVDGIGAYDHVLRAALLGRLERMPRARAILPFVRLSYAQLSTLAGSTKK